MTAFFIPLRFDLTEERLYTISDGSRKILENLKDPVRINFYYSRNNAELPPNFKTYAQRVEELLEEFSITHIRKNIAMTLSGGERRRTEIARALVNDPKFILLDEPYAGIDPIAVEEIQKIILRLKDKGIGILITDHNVRETLSFTDRSYLLYDGSILFSGTSKDIKENDEARRLYLGDSFNMKESQ